MLLLMVVPHEISHGYYWYEKLMYFISLPMHGPHFAVLDVSLSLIMAELKIDLTNLNCPVNPLDQSHTVVIHAN